MQISLHRAIARALTRLQGRAGGRGGVGVLYLIFLTLMTLTRGRRAGASVSFNVDAGVNSVCCSGRERGAQLLRPWCKVRRARDELSSTDRCPSSDSNERAEYRTPVVGDGRWRRRALVERGKLRQPPSLSSTQLLRRVILSVRIKRALNPVG